MLFRTSAIMTLILFLLASNLAAQTISDRWTSLDGPYWAKGIDVAYGNYDGEQQEYLVGNDGSSTRLFAWNMVDSKWRWPVIITSANKMVSYKNGGGINAMSTAYNDRIYKTENGGQDWSYVPNSQNIANRQFKTIEVLESAPLSHIYVGSAASSGIASAFKTTDGGSNWSSIGSGGLQNLDVNDLEYVTTINAPYTPYLQAATSSGIHKIFVGTPPDADWSIGAFNGTSVMSLEALDYGLGTWAQVASSPKKLYYTSSNPPWSSYSEIQPSPPTSFDKTVNDIAAIHVTNDGGADFQSVYIAAEDGLYLFDISAIQNPLTVRQVIDFKNDPTYANTPLAYDYPVLSVDYFQGSPQATTRYILIGTTYNVYLLTETRTPNSFRVPSITSVQDISKGTFISKVISVTCPDNSTGNQRIFSLSDNGIIKKYNGTDWACTGLAFAPGTTGNTSTDIAADFDGESQQLMTASNGSTSGIIMYSSNGGLTWSDKSPNGHPKINSVDFRLGASNSQCFAAGNADAWSSTNDGVSWTSGNFSNPNFKDISATEYPISELAYVCGARSPKAAYYNGYTWTAIETGLGGVSSLYQIIRETANVVYAATSSGVYKFANGSWSPRTNGTGAIEIGSIVKEELGYYPANLLAATPPSAMNSNIWASMDSGRTWLELYNGDIKAQNPHIYKLASALSGQGGFVAGTDKGVFFIKDVFKDGEYSSDETWGPGTLLLGSDVVISSAKLTITAPCTLLFNYCLDKGNAVSDPTKVEILVANRSLLTAIGTAANKIVFTSSRPGGGIKNDWGLISFLSWQAPTIGFDLQYCHLEYGDQGIYRWQSSVLDSLIVKNCTFKNFNTSGIFFRCAQDSILITDNLFDACGSYGIKIDFGWLSSSYKCVWIRNNEIVNCDYGIYYSGNTDGLHENAIIIYDNIIRKTLQGTGSTYGIYINNHTPGYPPPIALIESDSITYFGTGIYLNSVGDETFLQGIKAKRNTSYGIFIVNSNPQIIGTQEKYNAFNNSAIGMYYDYQSGGAVRWTKVKENTIYGVKIESHDGGSALPDFGYYWNNGNNSIHKINPGAGRYDMIYGGVTTSVNARGNWWGENPPLISGPIYYTPVLLRDPLPNLERRAVDTANRPTALTLRQNYPNPFNPETKISFSLGSQSYVSLRIYNIAGQVVNTLLAGNLAAGEHSIVWDGRNSEGKDAASGIYFYILSTDFGKETKSMTLIR